MVIPFRPGEQPSVPIPRSCHVRSSFGTGPTVAIADDVDSGAVGPLRGRPPAVGVLTAGGHLHARLAPPSAGTSVTDRYQTGRPLRAR
jgi:hypothetical protein